MPLLNSGAECCALRTGTYTVGGNGPDALPIASLDWCAAVATIVVPSGMKSKEEETAAEGEVPTVEGEEAEGGEAEGSTEE